MVYTNGSEIVTVNGGTFILDNVGNRNNGFPCIFNANGNNTKNIIVNGGTFNYDINHQYWCFEVNVPKSKALRNNGDGTWTVVESVAYVGEKVDSEYTHNVGYATLEEAIAAAKSGETITLVANVTLDGSKVVTEPAFGYDTIILIDNKALTIDFNGYTVFVAPTAANASSPIK